MRYALKSLVITWVWFSVWLTGSDVVAQSAPIEFQVDESRWVYRTGAPLQLRVKSICSAAGILHGDLEIQVNDGVGGVIAAIRIPDQVYSPGRQEVDYLLPVQSHRVQNSIGFTFLFRERDSTSNQPNGRVYTSVGLLIPPRLRSFVVPIVRSAAELDKAVDDYEWLAIESYCPRRSDNLNTNPMVTLLPGLAAEDLPRDPLKHLVHDAVVVEASAFPELAGAQVQALEAWVLGGGSLFLQLGRELPQEQSDFLERLLLRTPNLLADEIEGTELIPVLRSGAVQTLDYGFGRVCLTTEKTWSRAAKPDRLKVFMDLWRMRPEHRRSLAKTGKLSLEFISERVIQGWNDYNNSRMQMEMQIAARTQGISAAESQLRLEMSSWERMLLSSQSLRPGQMIETLLPRNVRTVPIWLLSAIVLAYILYIGFADYILLGKIHRRRLTWITFPVVTLAVTLLTIGTAKGYLGSSVEHNRVVIRDVADNGRICREQRFVLYFRDSSDTVAIPLKNEVYTPVANQPQNVRAGYVAPEPVDSTLLMFEGNPTGEANSIQTFKQWKPQLNRSVLFPRDQSVPDAIANALNETQPKLNSNIDKVRSTIPEAIACGTISATGFGGTAINNSKDEQVALAQSVLSMCISRPDGPNGGLSGPLTLFEKISPSADIGLFDLVCGSDEEIRYLAVKESDLLVIYRRKVARTP
jgi:hypothetical protein